MNTDAIVARFVRSGIEWTHHGEDGAETGIEGEPQISQMRIVARFVRSGIEWTHHGEDGAERQSLALPN
jgi:hypothetical protein